MPRAPLRLLSIGGSDSSGAAGVQADLKTFAAHGVYGMSVITAVTAQSGRGVAEVHRVPAGVVTAQLRAVLDDMGVDGIKIGMLGTAEIVDAVASSLEALDRRVPIVLDPVIAASDGARLLDPGGVVRMRERLFMLADVITPNLPEASMLLGKTVASREEREAAARDLCRAGGAVLLTGGHGQGGEIVDLLVWSGGTTEFRAPRLVTQSSRGTGCTLSSALALRLARGAELPSAAGEAISFVRRAMSPGLTLGAEHSPLDHGVDL